MHSVYCFSVLTDTHPSSLSRVLDVLTLFGQVPDQLVSRRRGPAGEDLMIDAQMSSMSADTAAAVARRLSRVVGITSVLYSEKRHSGEERWAA